MNPVDPSLSPELVSLIDFSTSALPAAMDSEDSSVVSLYSSNSGCIFSTAASAMLETTISAPPEDLTPALSVALTSALVNVCSSGSVSRSIPRISALLCRSVVWGCCSIVLLGL